MFRLKGISFEQIKEYLPNQDDWEGGFNKKQFLKNRYISIGVQDKDALYSYELRELDQIPWLHFLRLFQITEYLLTNKSIEALFSYGSLGSDKFNKKSDLDIYCLSSLDIKEVFELINAYFPISYIFGSKIVIHCDDFQIECQCIQDIQEAKKYLPESPYVPAEKRVFWAKDLPYTITILERIASETLDIEQTIQGLKTELYYYIQRLSYYTKDPYRLRFHGMIVEHCVICLVAIKNKNYTHNYLPRDTRAYLSEAEWKILNFGINDDPSLYIQNVTNFVDQLIQEMGGLPFFPKL